MSRITVYSVPPFSRMLSQGLRLTWISDGDFPRVTPTFRGRASMRRRHWVLAGLLGLSLGLLLVDSLLGFPDLVWAAAVSISTGVLLSALVLSARANRPRNDPRTGTVRHERIVHLGFAFLAFFLLVAELLVLPLPESLTRRLILASDDWIVTCYELTPAGLPEPIRSPSGHLLTTYLEHSLISHFLERHRLPPRSGDVERLMALLVPLKERLLSPHAVPHRPLAWPVVLSGIGWCDQMNRVAALALAREFRVSQTFNLCCVEPYAGHSMGRVWSAHDRGWLYYDIWGDDVVVYRLNRAGKPEFLARETPAHRRFNPPDIDSALERLYAASADGWVLNEYPATFGAYLFNKVWYAVSGRSPSQPLPLWARRAMEKFEQKHGESPARHPWPPAAAFDAEARRAFSRAYLEARLEHLLGDSSRAVSLYKQAAAVPVDPRDELLGNLRNAALMFSELLGRTTGAPRHSGLTEALPGAGRR